MNIDSIIASKIKDSRKKQHLTLDALAERSGISRSMISLIERQQSSPTAAVLNRLTDALGMSLPELFSDQLVEKIAISHAHHASLDEQQIWKDPESGYIRRQLTPRNSFSTVELTEITFPAKQRVTFDNMLRNIEIHQQVWVLAGEIIISDDESIWHLKQGDCLVFKQKEQTIFSNPGEVEARYLIALTSLPNT